jgi:hypothetical protein
MRYSKAPYSCVVESRPEALLYSDSALREISKTARVLQNDLFKQHESSEL